MTPIETLLAACAQACEGASEDVATISVVEERGDYRVTAYAAEERPKASLFMYREGGALASKVMWAPDDFAESRSCWGITAVRPGEDSVFGVGPYDGEWARIAGTGAPWFMVSTAAGIRSALERGEPLVVKRAGTATSDPRLFDIAARSNPPAPGEDGRI